MEAARLGYLWPCRCAAYLKCDLWPVDSSDRSPGPRLGFPSATAPIDPNVGNANPAAMHPPGKQKCAVLRREEPWRSAHVVERTPINRRRFLPLIPPSGRRREQAAVTLSASIISSCSPLYGAIDNRPEQRVDDQRRLPIAGGFERSTGYFQPRARVPHRPLLHVLSPCAEHNNRDLAGRGLRSSSAANKTITPPFLPPRPATTRTSVPSRLHRHGGFGHALSRASILARNQRIAGGDRQPVSQAFISVVVHNTSHGRNPRETNRKTAFSAQRTTIVAHLDPAAHRYPHRGQTNLIAGGYIG